MTEKSPSINMNSSEIKYTVGKVEKPIEQKIEDTARKIIDLNILDKNKFDSDQDRSYTADSLVESLGFNSYKGMLEDVNDENKPAIKDKALEAFDILRKSVSVAMNSGIDQELQTRLYLGSSKINEVLPESWKYVHPGTPEMNLPEKVLEVTITNPKIREVYREIDSITADFDLEDPLERKQAADEIAVERQKLLSFRKEMPEDQKSQWRMAKEYLSLRVGILDNELKPEDGSADKADVAAVLGDKMIEAAEKMSQAAEKIVEQNSNKDLRNLNKNLEKITKPKEQKPLDYDNLDINELNMRNLEIPKGDTPEGLQNQLKLARKVLDYVEFKWVYSYDKISSEIDFLKKIQSDPGCGENVKCEIKYRLSLNDMYMSAFAGDGKLGESVGRDREASIDYIADTLGINGGVTKDFIEFFFRKGKYKEMESNGYKINEAWNLLQDAGVDYKNLVLRAKNLGYADKFYGGAEGFLKIGNIIGKKFDNPKDETQVAFNEMFGQYGEVNYNWFWDGDSDRKSIMRDFMIDELAKRNNISRLIAEKSFDLTEKLYYATGENEYLNEDFIGTADMGKMMKVGIMRKIDWSKGKKSGPISTLNSVESCGISYFRMLANKKAFGSDLIGLEDKLTADKIDPNKIDGKYGYYLWGTALNINKFKVAYFSFMDRGFDLDKLIEPDSLASKLDAFNKLVDYVPNALENMSTNPNPKERKKENGVKARSWYIAGQLENALREGSKFNLLGLEKMYYYLVASRNIPVLETIEGREVVTDYTNFIPQESWDVLMGKNGLDVYNKLRVKGKLNKRFGNK